MNRPMIIADHVWDRGYVYIAFAPPLRPADWHRADCDPHWANAQIDVKDITVKTTDNGHVIVHLPSGEIMELVRHGGPRRCPAGCPPYGQLHRGPCHWTR